MKKGSSPKMIRVNGALYLKEAYAFEKYIKGGKVAVVTGGVWATGADNVGPLYDREIVECVLKKDLAGAAKLNEERYDHPVYDEKYYPKDLEVTWVPVGTKFRIRANDEMTDEWIEVFNEKHWLVA